MDAPPPTAESDVPALVVCSGCGAAAPTVRAPSGWVIARPTESRAGEHAPGVCPTCLADKYTFPAADPAAHATPTHIGP